MLKYQNIKFSNISEVPFDWTFMAARNGLFPVLELHLASYGLALANCIPN